MCPGDTWARAVNQDPEMPAASFEDVPGHLARKVSELRDLERGEISVVLATLASRFGRLPSMTLRPQDRGRGQPILRMWLTAAVLCHATNDRVSLRAWWRYQPGSASDNLAAIASSGLARQKVEVCRMIDALPPAFWRMLWRASTPDIINQHLNMPGLGHKTVACMILYGMRRPCLVVDHNVQVGATALFGLPATTPPEVVFWWLATQAPAGSLFDLSLLLLEEGRSNKSNKRKAS